MVIERENYILKSINIQSRLLKNKKLPFWSFLNYRL